MRLAIGHSSCGQAARAARVSRPSKMCSVALLWKDPITYHVITGNGIRVKTHWTRWRITLKRLSRCSDSYRETQGFGAHIEYVTDGPPRSTHPLQDHKDLTQLLKPDPLVSERMHQRDVEIDCRRAICSEVLRATSSARKS